MRDFFLKLIKYINMVWHKIYSFREHWIMQCDYSDKNIKIQNQLYIKSIKSIDELIDGTYSINLQKKVWMHNKDFCRTYILKETESQNTVGIASIMFKGGNELEYKIRNVEAFIFNVYIKPEYRGKGYAQVLLSHIQAELHHESIDSVYLAVSKDNESAISAYKKINFKVVGTKKFIRILRHNVPYYSI